jgi:glutathione S-transferase
MAPTATPPRALLVAIPFSHYVERARWALDVANIPSTQLRLMPMLHLPVVPIVRWWYAVAAKRADRVSSGASTPALVLFDARGRACATLSDSGDIVAWAAAHATPGALHPAPGADADGAVAAQIARVERLCHDELGPAARVAVYRYLLPTPHMRQLAWRNVGPAQAALWASLCPLLAWALGAALRVDAARGDRAEAKLAALFERVGEQLAATGLPPASAYLAGDRFTSADLTFAALAYPVLGVGAPDGLTSCWTPAAGDVAPGFAALCARLRATRAGAHALRMWREHRGGPGGGDGLKR